MDNTGRAGIAAASQAISTSEFGFQNSAHMYNILSDTLYSDGILAALREVGCNAMDSHITAGKPDLPIEVKLPNAMSPEFYIKDFGIGLSEEGVRMVAAPYGNSTKAQDDETTGGFGLGFKSPFACAESFTITAVKDGVQVMMVAHKTGEGVPCITKIGEQPASPDWPSGVKISWAVLPSEFETYRKKATEAFRWFRTKPRVLGAVLDLVVTEYPLRWDSYGLSLSSNGLHKVVMGGVAYPLHIENILVQADLGPAARDLVKAGSCLLMLPMGAVHMTPSREQLKYTKRTLASVVAALNDAAVSMGRGLRNLLLSNRERDCSHRLKVIENNRVLSMVSQALLTKAVEWLELEDGKDAAEVIRWAMSNRNLQCALPRSLGDGAPGVYAKKLLDFELALAQKVKDGDALLAQVSPLRELAKIKHNFRAWVLESSSKRSSSKAAPTKSAEVVKGRLATVGLGTETVQANVTAPAIVLLADMPGILLKVRRLALPVEWAGRLVLLVVPTGKADVEAVKESIAKLAELNVALQDAEFLVASQYFQARGGVPAKELTKAPEWRKERFKAEALGTFSGYWRETALGVLHDTAKTRGEDLWFINETVGAQTLDCHGVVHEELFGGNVCSQLFVGHGIVPVHQLMGQKPLSVVRIDSKAAMSRVKPQQSGLRDYASEFLVPALKEILASKSDVIEKSWAEYLVLNKWMGEWRLKEIFVDNPLKEDVNTVRMVKVLREKRMSALADVVELVHSSFDKVHDALAAFCRSEKEWTRLMTHYFLSARLLERLAISRAEYDAAEKRLMTAYPILGRFAELRKANIAGLVEIMAIGELSSAKVAKKNILEFICEAMATDYAELEGVLDKEPEDTRAAFTMLRAA